MYAYIWCSPSLFEYLLLYIRKGNRDIVIVFWFAGHWNHIHRWLYNHSVVFSIFDVWPPASHTHMRLHYSILSTCSIRKLILGCCGVVIKIDKSLIFREILFPNIFRCSYYKYFSFDLRVMWYAITRTTTSTGFYLT